MHTIETLAAVYELRMAGWKPKHIARLLGYDRHTHVRVEAMVKHLEHYGAGKWRHLDAPAEVYICAEMLVLAGITKQSIWAVLQNFLYDWDYVRDLREQPRKQKQFINALDLSDEAGESAYMGTTR